MGDEQHGHAFFTFQSIDQRKDFGLNCDVKCRGRLVRDQQLRRAGHRHRDHDPLPHAARKFMRILLQPPLRFGDAHAFQKLNSPCCGGPLAQPLVQHQPIGQLAFNGENRVQRRHRLLKDHPDFIAAHRTHDVR